MGIIKVKENLGEGRYKVSIERDLERAKKYKESLQKQVDELTKKIQEFTDDKNNAQVKANAKAQEVDIERQKLIDRGDLINSLSQQLDSENTQVTQLDAQLTVKQNTKTSLTNQINSGNYTGQDLANLQTDLDAVEVDITNLSADLKSHQDIVKNLEKQISDLKNPAKAIEALEKLVNEQMTLVMEVQKFQTEIEINRLIIEKKKKRIAAFSDQINLVDIRDIWCVDYKTDLELGADDVETQLENIQSQINSRLTLQASNQNRLDDLLASGLPNDNQQVKDAKTAIKNNQDEIDALKVQKEALLRKQRKISVEIIDENQHILIAPYTYVLKQKDLDDKQDYINKKNQEKNALDAKVFAKQDEIDQAQLELEDINQKIVNKSVLLANVITQGDPEATKAQQVELNAEIDALKQKMLDQLSKITKLTKEYNKLDTQSDRLAALIVRLQAEYSDLQSAFNTQEKIYEPHVTDRSLQFQPVIVSSPEATFFNKSLLPGVQKWKPTYRLGVITAINNDACDVTLEAAESSQQGLNVNQAVSLTNVPIKYGDCDSAAFVVNDRVVVQFRNNEQSDPIVIGFEDNPRPCGLAVTTAKTHTSAKLYRRSTGNPVENNSFANHGRYWYSVDKKKCLAWDSTPTSNNKNSFVDRHIYIAGKRIFLSSSVSTKTHCLAACYANKAQTDIIKAAYPNVKGDIIILALGKHPAELNKICAYECDGSDLLDISSALSFDISLPAPYTSINWYGDVSFSRDSTALFTAFAGSNPTIGYETAAIVRYGLFLSNNAVLTVTDEKLWEDTTENVRRVVYGDMDDENWWFVLSSTDNSGEGYKQDRPDGSIVYTMSCNLTKDLLITTNKINVSNNGIVLNIDTLFHRPCVSTGSGTQDLDGNGNASFTTNSCFVSFHFYDAKSKIAGFSVIDVNTSMTMTKVAGAAVGDSRTINVSQKCAFYLHRNNSLVEVNTFIPSYTFSETNTTNGGNIFKGNDLVFIGASGVLLSDDDRGATERLREGRFSLNLVVDAFVENAIKLYQFQESEFSPGNLFRFGVIPILFMKSSNGENGKIFIYRSVIHVSGNGTPLSPNFQFGNAQGFDIENSNNEFVIDTSFQDVSVTR